MGPIIHELTSRPFFIPERNGDLYEQYDKAINYISGTGVNKDIHTAIQLLRKVNEEESLDLASVALKSIFHVRLGVPCVDGYNTPPHWMDTPPC
jgi:hypothetical protein